MEHKLIGMVEGKPGLAWGRKSLENMEGDGWIGLDASV